MAKKYAAGKRIKNYDELVKCSTKYFGDIDDAPADLRMLYMGFTAGLSFPVVDGSTTFLAKNRMEAEHLVEIGDASAA